MKVTIDQDLCIGCGLCESVCPQIFTIGKNEKAEVHENVDPAPYASEVEEAADGCPVSAITVENQ